MRIRSKLDQCSFSRNALEGTKLTKGKTRHLQLDLRKIQVKLHWAALQSRHQKCNKHTESWWREITKEEVMHGWECGAFLKGLHVMFQWNFYKVH